jgi:hypothetical protein
LGEGVCDGGGEDVFGCLLGVGGWVFCFSFVFFVGGLEEGGELWGVVEVRLDGIQGCDALRRGERRLELKEGNREKTDMSANADRKNIPSLVAKVDPGNIASEKLVKRIGGRKGEVLKEVS